MTVRKKRPPTEAQVDDALRVIRRDYYHDVRGLAEEVAGRMREPGEDLSDVVHETVDGSSRVIYTREAMLGLIASDNSEEYEADTGGDPVNWSERMFFALKQDVYDALREVPGGGAGLLGRRRKSKRKAVRK